MNKRLSRLLDLKMGKVTHKADRPGGGTNNFRVSPDLIAILRSQTKEDAESTHAKLRSEN